MAERKLDMFQLLRAADQCDGNWFSKQPEDAQKEFAPIVVTRWASTVGDGPESVYMLWMVNERVNVNLFDLHKHPDLVYRLMASCGLGKPLRHIWVAGNKRKNDNNKAYALLQERYPEASDRELNMLMSLYTKESFSQFVNDCGIQAAEAKEILKAYEQFGK
jgi:hypothetical protein